MQNTTVQVSPSADTHQHTLQSHVKFNGLTPTKQQEDMAKFFSAISHKRRLMIFNLLLRHGVKGMPHEQLVMQTQMAVSTLGHHLRHMQIGNVLIKQQRGQQVWISIDYAAFNTQMRQFKMSMDDAHRRH